MAGSISQGTFSDIVAQIIWIAIEFQRILIWKLIVHADILQDIPVLF